MQCVISNGIQRICPFMCINFHVKYVFVPFETQVFFSDSAMDVEMIGKTTTIPTSVDKLRSNSE